MKKWFGFLSLLVFFYSCSKTGIIQDPGAGLLVSADTLHYDTLFTTTGSITQFLKINNPNEQTISLSEINLAGGSASAYKMNVDGTAGSHFTNIEILPGDSLYIFVSASIGSTPAVKPFIISDSISIKYNGNNRWVQLQAYGQNAHFFKNVHVTKDSSWTSELPFVITGSLTVDSDATLTINKGCKIYSHADAPFVVNGSLEVAGGAGDGEQVVFQGDRLDEFYKDLPAAWPGIFFSSSSTANSLTHAEIRNAYQGLVTENATSTATKLTLNQCVIDNIYDAGIAGYASSIKATNCLISNCGSNIILLAGGNYQFDYCTVATIGNLFIDHKNPVLYVSNADALGNINMLSARFRNTIFYGQGGTAEDEVAVQKKGSPTAQQFQVSFNNVLYKQKNNVADATFNNSINEAPQFDSIDATRRTFSFKLQSTSPAIDKALVLPGITTDLLSKTRDSKPDIGCYEY